MQNNGEEGNGNPPHLIFQSIMMSQQIRKANDVNEISGNSKDPKVVNMRNLCMRNLKIGTWNVRTTEIRGGNLENVERNEAKWNQHLGFKRSMMEGR